MNTDAKKPKIFFDISSLIDYVTSIDQYSGIQRVVVKIISEFYSNSDGRELYVSFFDNQSENYICLSLDELGVENFKSAQKLKARLGIGRQGPPSIEILKKYENNRVKYLFHKKKLDIFARFDMEARLKRYNLTPSMWRRLQQELTKGSDKLQGSKQSFDSMAKPGDHLVGLDSSWLDRHERVFSKAKQSGIIVHTFVHDLIPILKPETTHGMMPLIFHKWLVNSMKFTSNYIANSEATRGDLLDFLEKSGATFEVKAIPLAQDAVEINDKKIEVGPLTELVDSDRSPWLAEVGDLKHEIRYVANAPYVLCVGTIEVRKNAWRIAQAWQRLIEQKTPNLPKLVFAGRKGWLIEDFDRFLHATGHISGWVEVIEGPSDQELDFLYRNCKFGIMASTYEGWGLPVGETLAFGKTLVVANVSSLPEVGMDLVEYCDPLSIQSIADACEKLIASPERVAELEQKISETRLRSWADVALDLSNEIDNWDAKSQ